MQQMITILGPTACGKTRVAVGVARELARRGQPAEIISADSRQVYRRMDIGTGKDLSEYGDTPYHLIDICEPGTKYNLFEYQKDCRRALADVQGRGAVPILCGGTGLYLEAILKDYDISPVPQNPELRQQLEGKSLDELTEMLRQLKARNGSVMHNTTDVDTAQRAIRAIEIESFQLSSSAPKTIYSPLLGRGAGGEAVEAVKPFGLSIPRELRRERITQRLKARLDEGMVDEVRRLLDEGIPADDLIYYGLEYKFVTQYVIGQLSYDEMYRQLEIAIHQFAKRQMTWFRGMERRGTPIHWIDATLPLDDIVNDVLTLRSALPLGFAKNS